MRYLAQDVTIEGQRIQGPLVGIEKVADIVNKIVSFLIPLAAVILFIVLVWGGINLIFSEGNPEKIKSARGKITAGVIGFLLLLFAYLIVKVISSIFGIGVGIF